MAVHVIARDIVISVKPLPVQDSQALADREPRLIGIDFTSAPTRRKPITLAAGHLDNGRLVVDNFELFEDFDCFEQFLARPGPWVGGFDLPFGLPRELVEHWGWPRQWADLIRMYAGMSRQDLRLMFKAFCDARPVGNKFAHRQTDRPAGSSPSMKW